MKQSSNKKKRHATEHIYIYIFVSYLVGNVFSNQHEHNVASMGIYCDEAHDALTVISLQLRPRELDELVELIYLLISHMQWNWRTEDAYVNVCFTDVM